MRHGGRQYIILGLVLLFTLLATAVHASGVNVSYRLRAAAIPASRVLDSTDSVATDHATGLLTAQPSYAVPQQLRPSSQKFLSSRFLPPRLFVSVAMHQSREQQPFTSLLEQFIYANHPRPPTALSRTR